MTEDGIFASGTGPSSPAPVTDDQPSQIGPYRILGSLGEGGMSVVYLAEQSEPVRRRVALKILKAGMDSKQVVARFESERQALAVLDHPNIAKIFDGGIAESGRPYFVMEQVKGVPITDYCDDQRLDNEQRLKVFIKVCSAVQHAHLKGLIHRDLKPSNILVGVVDGEPQPKIIDFGIAKATSTSLTDSTLYTRIGQIIGTPQYMSPEQAGLTGLDIDTRSDIYSLGVVLYELLVGTVPLDLRAIGDQAMQVAIREKDPPKPSTRFSELGDTRDEISKIRRTGPDELRRQLQGDLDWIVMRAIEKDRTRRYETANALAMDCRRFLKHEPVLARPPSTTYHLQRFVQRNRLVVMSGLVAILAIIAGASAATVGYIRATEAEDAALVEAETSRQVSDFLVQLFEVSDPSEARGNSITAREIMDKGAARIETELATQPAILATLLETLGSVYTSLGLYDQAESLLQSALEKRLALFGEEHLEVARSMHSLGRVLALKAEYEPALQFYQDALAMRRKLLGDENVETASTIFMLADVLSRMGNFPGAEPMFREALTLQKKLLGEKNSAVAQSLEGLGLNLFDQGNNYDDAVALMREAVAMQRDLQIGPHPDLAEALNNLGFVITDDLEAERLFRESLAMKQVLYAGEAHPEIALGLNNVAFLLHDKGQYDEAEEMYRAAYNMQRKLLGEDHPDVALTLNNLAFVVYDQGDLDAATALSRESLEMFRRTVGDEHPEVARGMNNLAMWQMHKRDYASAEPLLREALDLRVKLLGPDHPAVAASKTLLAYLLVETGRFEDALPLARGAREIYEETFTADHLRTANAASAEGAALAGLKRYDEAESLLVASYKVLSDDTAARPFYISRTRQWLVQLYVQTGRPAEAERYRRTQGKP